MGKSFALFIHLFEKDFYQTDLNMQWRQTDFLTYPLKQDLPHSSDLVLFVNGVAVFLFSSCSPKGSDSSVRIATHYGLDRTGIESRWGASFSAPIQTGPGAHPASYTMGTGSFPWVK